MAYIRSVATLCKIVHAIFRGDSPGGGEGGSRYGDTSLSDTPGTGPEGTPGQGEVLQVGTPRQSDGDIL